MIMAKADDNKKAEADKKAADAKAAAEKKAAEAKKIADKAAKDAEAAKAKAAKDAEKAAEKAKKEASRAEEKAAKEKQRESERAAKKAEKEAEKAKRKAEREANKGKPKAWEDLPAGAKQQPPRDGSVGAAMLAHITANKGATEQDLQDNVCSKMGKGHNVRKLIRFLHQERGYGFTQIKSGVNTGKITFQAPNLVVPTPKPVAA